MKATETQIGLTNLTRGAQSQAVYLYSKENFWQSKKQTMIALSTTEAEYMALSSTCQEALWLQSLAREIDPESVDSGITIYCDNREVIDLAKTTGYRPRGKHIDVTSFSSRTRQSEGHQLEIHPNRRDDCGRTDQGIVSPKIGDM